MRSLWRLVAVSLGAVHAYVAIGQQSMNTDGVNYLEMGAAYWRGDWEMALNGIWSPLYGVIVGGVLQLVEPSVRWVFPTVQIVNFVIFLFALAAFEFLWREALLRYRDRHDGWDGAVLTPGLFWSVGYALFLWSSLNLIEMWAVTPDMLVSVMVFLSAGSLLRLLRTRALWPSVGLGLSLGVGYLAKAPMFPLAIVCFLVAIVAIGGLKRGARLLAPAGLAFVLVAGPFLVALSVKEGHPTFSEVSRFTYLKHVNRIPYPRLREGATVGLGSLDHPQHVHSAPDVFSFAGPVRGSYPPSYDPDYFTEGLSPRVSIREQLNATAFNLAFYFRLFFRSQGAFLGLAALLGFLASRTYRPREMLAGEWHLAVWAVACFGMYSLVFVTGRYVAPFVVLFWLGILSYWRLGPSKLARSLSSAVAVLMVLAILADVAALNVDGFASVAGLTRPVEGPTSQFSDGPTASRQVVAEALAELGVDSGTDVALVGDGFRALWAHLAQVRIVAEVPIGQAADFWRAPPEVRASVLRAFAKSGAHYAIAEVPPPDPISAEGWAPLGDVGYWIANLGADPPG